ncbi:hypothetical protein ACOI1H_14780 [Loktanella sp. DJP18]|uniref:hypothetical protein n=1 Tax=Loktanella sp. DJP18 TaxID=3409788 RepID=UPI003BB7BF4F
MSKLTITLPDRLYRVIAIGPDGKPVSTICAVGNGLMRFLIAPIVVATYAILLTSILSALCANLTVAMLTVILTAMGVLCLAYIAGDTLQMALMSDLSAHAEQANNSLAKIAMGTVFIGILALTLAFLVHAFCLLAEKLVFTRA